MKNKLFMTFGGAVAAMCPWLARAETFPTDGNMLENTTYESAATYDNMGVYDGTVTAAAEYADALYNAAAGQYLPAASEDVATCPAGYYCMGATGLTYNESRDQGLSTCPDGYANSDAGASDIMQCYTTCSDTSVIAHAAAVAGNDYYYYDDVDTCYATECVSGYHMANGIGMALQEPLIAGADFRRRADGYELTENGTWTARFEYGTVYGQASCQPASPNALAMAYYSGMVNSHGYHTADEVRSQLLTYGIDAERTDAVVDVFAKLEGGIKTEEDAYKVAWAILGTEHDANFSKTDSGAYCYCQMTDFKPTNGVKGSVTSAPWVIRTGDGLEGNCNSSCAYYCATSLSSDYAHDRAFRAAVLGALGTRTVDVCAANEISITWDGADAADVAANNAGTCTYDGDIRTPVKAQSVPGKIFKGWKFNK